MACVSQVSCVITINIAYLPPFMPENGILQGDPLSPYILIVSANNLSDLIRQG